MSRSPILWPLPAAFRPGPAIALALLLAMTSPRGMVTSGYAAETTPLPTITDPSLVWSMPTEQKSLVHPLRIEGRVDYFDPSFKLFWIERDHVVAYLQLSAKAPALHTGQYVAIEGTIIPNQGLEADRVEVKVLQENAPVTPLATLGRINDTATLGSRIVTAEGYVDSQQYIDADHVRLLLIVENRQVICWVKPTDPKHVPDWQGRFVRATGLYSSRFDPTHTRMTIEFWLGVESGLQVLGTLQDYSLFDRPVTPIGNLFELPEGTETKVHGRLEEHDVGTSMILRDETGQVEIRSIQQQRLPVNSEVEAVGRIRSTGDHWVLDEGLYRQSKTSPAGTNTNSGQGDGTLKTVAQICALGSSEATGNRPVDITGMVTWSLPETEFFYLQDVTGGIRVYYDRSKTGLIPYGKYFRVKGSTRPGRLEPVVVLDDFTDLGSMSHPRPQPITLQEAFAGKTDGEWVELRGFLRDTVSEGDWRWIHVTTPVGDFTGHLQSPVNFVANPGSLIRVHGVCEATVGDDGRVSSIVLRIPFLHDITIEQDAPANFYDLPRRPVRSLESLALGENMMRVRVSGVVEHAVTGQRFYLQDNGVGLLLLSHQKQPLQAGDRVEAVGILGHEGFRTILREAVYRRIGSGPAPEPQGVENPGKPSPSLDASLVRVRGRLLDVLESPGRTRLALQQGSAFFEAILEQPTGAVPPDLSIGAGLEVTGIYQQVFDDSGRARGFRVQLRSPGDVVVYAPARLWTVQRALVTIAVLAGCIMVGLAWIFALRRRVREQTTQIRTQIEQQSRLESEVQRAARLESLGVLAGGIAHDFNNLLTVIMGNLSLIKLAPQVMNAEADRVCEIERGTIRARDLTRQLLTFARGGDPLRTSTALPGIVREAMDLVLQGTRVHAEYNFPPDLWSAHVDRDQIAQAVQNMALNAMQAMPSGGVIRVALTNSGSAPIGLSPGRYVRLTVADSGEGIPPEILPRIFDPYFSTRKSGSGLGLATVYSIIKKHQGRIEVNSHSGHGATFTIWLPAAEVTAAARPEPARPVALPIALIPGSQPRVLLMDDEESIRLLGSTLLSRMGLEPTVVADGAGAIREFELARDAGRPFSLLIFDLTIPGGIGGQAAMAAIRQIDGRVPAIVSSGHARDPVMANFQTHGFQAVVEKPYEVKMLAETVRRLLPTLSGSRQQT
jgi:two-component system, cell cycle sensor histidine kinase and response regulator CckA